MCIYMNLLPAIVVIKDVKMYLLTVNMASCKVLIGTLKITALKRFILYRVHIILHILS